ncbi:MAG: hypothetical protein IJ094_10135 [Bacilli bacterium]|nr:hypothetical protein [Bacilli bacterium]
MDWQKVYDLLNGVEEKYDKFREANEYILDEKNYETNNNGLNGLFFYFVRAIKEKVKTIPVNFDSVRTNAMNFGNDAVGMEGYLSKVNDDIDKVIYAVRILKDYQKISDISYEYEDGYENSLKYKSFCDKIKKIAEVFEDEKMTLEQKYKYCDSFEKTLSKEENGELTVQSIIGKEDNALKQTQITQVVLSLMGKDNFLSKMDQFYQFFLELGSYAEEKLDTYPLEQHIKDLEVIYDSKFYKSLEANKTIK